MLGVSRCHDLWKDLIKHKNRELIKGGFTTKRQLKSTS